MHRQFRALFIDFAWEVLNLPDKWTLRLDFRHQLLRSFEKVSVEYSRSPSWGEWIQFAHHALKRMGREELLRPLGTSP